jgi:hypothetical protein
VSIVQFDIDRVDGEDPGREQLLAVLSLRRSVESGSAHEPASTRVAKMTRPDTASARSSPARTIRELHELIAALERRVPHVERVGEIAIARAAAALKSEALRRIEELERGARREAEVSDAPTCATSGGTSIDVAGRHNRFPPSSASRDHRAR